METIHKWLIENRITEVEVLVPDMTGNARGKFIPAAKYMKQDNPRLPEGILAQAVNGDYPAATGELAIATCCCHPATGRHESARRPENHARSALGQGPDRADHP